MECIYVYFINYCSSNKKCPVLFNFLSGKKIIFAGMDIRGDRRAMARSWDDFQITEAYHVDIQMLYQVDGVEWSGMASLAAELISYHYTKMKVELPSKHHGLWEESPLHEVNLHYAAVDGYVSYELYRKIKRIKMGLQLHLQPTY